MNNSHLVKKPCRVTGKKSVGFYYFKGKKMCQQFVTKNGEEKEIEC